MNVILAGIKEADLCITKDVLFSALCKTDSDLDSHVLRTQLLRHHVDKNDIILLGQLRMPSHSLTYFGSDIFCQLRDEALLKIFYLCLRETQDVCSKHQILADDLKWEARSEFTIVC